MRIRALVMVGLMAALPAFGQGTLTFLNTAAAIGGTGAPVTDGVGGARLSGATFQAQLYAELTPGNLSAIGSPVAFRTGGAAGFVTSTQVAVPGMAVNSSVNVQMRAWEASGGATYEAALASGAKTGFSNTISVGPLGGVPAVGPPVTDPNLIGLNGFAVVVPEPSTIALGLLGAAALLIRRRK